MHGLRAARDVIPIRLVVTPQGGEPVSIDAMGTGIAGIPTAIQLPVNIPANVLVNINVFTR